MLRVAATALLGLAACDSYIETIGTLPSSNAVIGFSGYDILFGASDAPRPIQQLSRGEGTDLTAPVQVVGFGQDADDTATVLVAPADAPVAMHVDADGTLTPLATNAVRAGATTIVQDAGGIRFTAGGATSVLAPGSTMWIDGPVQLDTAIRARDGHVYGRVVGQETVVRMDAVDVAVPVSCGDCAGFIGTDYESLLYFLDAGQVRVARSDGSIVATMSVPDDPFAAAMSPGGGIVVVASDAGYRLYAIGARDLYDVTPSFDVTGGARVVASSARAYLVDGTSMGVVTAYE